MLMQRSLPSSLPSGRSFFFFYLRARFILLNGSVPVAAYKKANRTRSVRNFRERQRHPEKEENATRLHKSANIPYKSPPVRRRHGSLG